MKELESGSQTIQKICDHLIEQTLKPAKNEAQLLIEEAEKKAAELIGQGDKEKQRLIQEAKAEIEKEKKMAQSALLQSATQTLEGLRQAIIKDLFLPELSKALQVPLEKSDCIADLIRAIVEAIEKQGVDVKLEALIPSKLSVEDVNALLGQRVLERLSKESVKLGNFHSGVEVRLEGKEMTIVLSDDTLKDIVASYIRKELRERIFK